MFGHVQPKPLNNVNGHICQICGDDVGVTAEGELFVACNECAFPVCRPCYDYERKDGNQSCPQCRTRYKRHRGIAISGFVNDVYHVLECDLALFMPCFAADMGEVMLDL